MVSVSKWIFDLIMMFKFLSGYDFMKSSSGLYIGLRAILVP